MKRTRSHTPEPSSVTEPSTASEPLVVKIGGAVAEDTNSIDRILSDMAAFAVPGRRIMLVHGGGRSISEYSRRLGLEPQFLDGIRLTTEAEMDIVDMVLAGLVNTALVRRAAAHGIAAIGLSGADAQLLLGERLHATSRTARPVASTTVALDAAWAAGLVPIVAPVGSDATHTAVNINADDAAQTLAEAVGPGTVLCYISDIPGVLDKNGDTLPTITVPEIEALIAAGVAHGGMAAKLRSAARALRAGVGAVTIGDISGDSDLESLLNRKRGTTIISA